MMNTIKNVINNRLKPAVNDVNKLLSQGDLKPETREVLEAVHLLLINVTK